MLTEHRAGACCSHAPAHLHLDPGQGGNRRGSDLVQPGYLIQAGAPLSRWLMATPDPARTLPGVELDLIRLPIPHPLRSVTLTSVVPLRFSVERASSANSRVRTAGIACTS